MQNKQAIALGLPALLGVLFSPVLAVLTLEVAQLVALLCLWLLTLPFWISGESFSSLVTIRNLPLNHEMLMLLSAALSYAILQRAFFRSQASIGSQLGSFSIYQHGKNIALLSIGTFAASLLGHLAYVLLVSSDSSATNTIHFDLQFGEGLYGAFLAFSFLAVTSQHFNVYLSAILTFIGITFCSGLLDGSNYQAYVSLPVIAIQIALFTWKRDTFALFVCLLLSPLALQLGRLVVFS